MSRKAAATPPASGWLRRDFEQARREIKEYPADLRSFLDGTYRSARSTERE